MPLADLLRLFALVFAAVSSVVLGDTAGKLLTVNGADPLFIAWTRFVLAAVILLPFSGFRISELSVLRNWRVWLRAGFIAGGIACILTALKTEPIANVFGAFFVGPIVSYTLAVLILGEHPTLIRSGLLAIGFVGVVLVVKPGFGASSGMFFALAAGGSYGAYLMMTRLLAYQVRPRLLLLSQLAIGAVLLCPPGLNAALTSYTPWIMFLIMVSAMGSAFGNLLLVLASRRAEASLIAPLVYSQLISATVVGVVVFEEWPDTLALTGLGLILFSGFASLLAHYKC